MKILFVLTDINTFNFNTKIFHFGISILSAVLKQDRHIIKLFYQAHKYHKENFLKTIREFNPDIIAFTSDSTQILYIRKIIKDASVFNKFIILGGAHASLAPNCLQEIEGLNAICRGEGEEPLRELASAIGRKDNFYNIKNINFKTSNGEIIINPLRPFRDSLDDLPFLDLELFDFQKIIDLDFGRASFMLSRGCPFFCYYCASPAMGRLQPGKYVRFMSVERAISEIEYMKKKYKFKSIFFADDTFTIDKNFIYEFCQEYKRRINIPFEVNSRVESASPEIFKALKDAGCFKVHMGIESGDEDFRKNILNRKMSNQQIIDAFRWVKEVGLFTKSYNIVGFPYETLQIHQQTIDLNCKINPDGHVCYIFQPYPGTKLYEVCKSKGYIKKDYSKNGTISRRDTVLDMPDFRPDEIIKSHRNFSFQIYKKTNLKKALIYKIYYSQYGEILLRFFSPFKNFLRDLVFKKSDSER